MDGEPATGGLPWQQAGLRGRQHALAASGDAQASTQVGTREGFVMRGDGFWRAFSNDVTALRACTGTELHEPVRRAQQPFIMLDDEHGVAEVTQALEGADQTLGVRRVQADAGFVEHVEHSGQARTNLRGQADALHLTARKRAALAIQRQIAQAHLIEEFETFEDLLQQIGHVAALKLAEHQPLHPRQCVADGKVAEVVDRQARRRVQFHRERLGSQAFAGAGRTGFGIQKARHLGTQGFALRRGVQALGLHRQPFEGLGQAAAVLRGFPTCGDRLTCGAVKQRLLEGLRQGFEGSFQGHAKVAGQRLHALILQRLHLRHATPPGADRACSQAFQRIRHQQRGIGRHHRTDALAGGAGAEVGVEGKMLGRQLFQQVTGARVGVGRGKTEGLFRGSLASTHQEPNLLTVPSQRRLDALHQTRAHAVAHDQPVHHHLDPLRSRCRRTRRGLLQLPHLPIHPHADEALTTELFEQALQIARLTFHHWREHDHAGAFLQRQHPPTDLLRRVAREHLARDGIMRHAGHRIEHAQVVVNLRDGGDGGARVGRGMRLLNRHGRTQTFDEIHVRLFQLIQKLPGVGGKALHVTTLALGVERVESQGGLARAAHPGHHHQPVAWQVQIHVLQVVLARPAHSDDVWLHR